MTKSLVKLLRKGADPNQAKADRWTALHYACDLAYIEIANALLIAGASPNIRNTHGNTPLHFAVDTCQVYMVNLLLKFGADMSVANARGITPLHLAARRNLSDVAMRFLVDDSVDRNPVSDTGKTPMHEAILYQSPKVVPVLAVCGADIDQSDGFGDTPLHLAARQGAVGMIGTLLCSGANYERRNLDGLTADAVAVRHTHFTAAEFIVREAAAQRRFFLVRLRALVIQDRAVPVAAPAVVDGAAAGSSEAAALLDPDAGPEEEEPLDTGRLVGLPDDVFQRIATYL